MDAFRTRIEEIHRQLGIPEDYAARTGLPLQQEPDTLVAVVVPQSDRQHQLTPETAARWAQMEAAAERDAVRLQLLSAYRSVDYQAGLIERKLERGLTIEDILRVNAAPGFSEHHSGRAVDIGAPDCEPLSEAFEQTQTFRWLEKNAHRWGFSMSYGRRNPHGIVYEPWHWAIASA